MDVITVSSFKGGTAKTSTVLHIGAALAKWHKKKVLLVDFDAQANLTLGLGYDPDGQDSLAPVLQGKKAIQDIILPTCVKNLDLIPADPWLERVEVTGALASDRYSHERLKHLLVPLQYDLIIIDTPPSLSWLTESALIAASSIIVAVTAEFYSVKGLERLSEFIKTVGERHPLTVLGVILSFWNPRGKNNSSFLKVIDQTFPNGCFTNKIRRDIAVSEAAVHGKPLFEIPRLASQSRAAEDFQKLAEEVFLKMPKRKKGALV
jgi:chromosome partitioning protein